MSHSQSEVVSQSVPWRPCLWCRQEWAVPLHCQSPHILIQHFLIINCDVTTLRWLMMSVCWRKVNDVSGSVPPLSSIWPVGVSQAESVTILTLGPATDRPQWEPGRMWGCLCPLRWVRWPTGLIKLTFDKSEAVQDNNDNCILPHYKPDEISVNL